MWIKTPQGKLINTDNILKFSFFVPESYGTSSLAFSVVATPVVANDGKHGIPVAIFEEALQAKKYLDKLAEKLGAEAIDFVENDDGRGRN